MCIDHHKVVHVYTTIMWYMCIDHHKVVYTVADPGFLKGGGARSAPQNLAPPTFYIIIINGTRARPSHEQNRTRTSELAKFRGGI